MPAPQSLTHSRSESGRLVDGLESAWYAGLVSMLAVDIALRDIDGDLPSALVLSGWLIAFAVPFLALAALRRRNPDR